MNMHELFTIISLSREQMTLISKFISNQINKRTLLMNCSRTNMSRNNPVFHSRCPYFFYRNRHNKASLWSHWPLTHQKPEKFLSLRCSKLAMGGVCIQSLVTIPAFVFELARISVCVCWGGGGQPNHRSVLRKSSWRIPTRAGKICELTRSSHSKFTIVWHQFITVQLPSHQFVWKVRSVRLLGSPI